MRSRIVVAGSLTVVVVALLSFAVVARQQRGSDQATTPVAQPESPWSVSTSHGSARSTSPWLNEIAAAGVTAVRGFTDDGSLATAANAKGLSSTGFLLWSPTGSKETTFPVDDLSGWRDYVAKTVRNQPLVHRWEVWNEPPNFTADTSAAAYATVVGAAYDVIKRENPSLQVGLAVKSTDVAFLADAIDAGAAGRYDYITLHPYERLQNLFDGWDASFAGIVPEVRAMLAVHDPARAGVPIDFTELGSPVGNGTTGAASSHRTADDQADALVKGYVLALAQGVRSVSWYDAWDGDASVGEAPFGLVESDGTPRPAYVALKTLIGTLGEHPGQPQIRELARSATVVEFPTTRGRTLIAWSNTGARLRFQSDVTIGAFAGGGTTRAGTVALNQTPRLIKIDSGATYSVVSAVTDRPATTLAGSSYRAAWSAGGNSSGLLARGGTTRTWQGRPVLDMSSSRSLDLAVLSSQPYWGSSRLRVQATVYARSPSAGLNLKFDAGSDVADRDDSGQAIAGTWRALTPGTWQTLTWDVDSADLVGVYGVNLRLDSDSTEHSNYLISAVSVDVVLNGG